MEDEALDNEIVEAHVASLLDEVLGEDHDVDLPSSRGLVERNRKSVREFASGAISVVRAWCRLSRVPVPEPWKSEDPQSATRHLDNAGLLDFEPVRDMQILELCHRAACWPGGMPRTLDPAPLGLDRVAVEEEERRRQKVRQRRVIENRSNDFAGTKLDTADPSFAESFRQVAEASLAGWRRRGKSPPDDLKEAMGLASEWLVFQFLRRRYGDAAAETCWVSANRARFFGGDEGDDAAGYDFCAKTPQAD